MAYKTNRLGVGLPLGIQMNWKITKTDPKGGDVFSYYSIMHYVTSLYQLYISLPKKNVKTKRKTKEQKRFRIPILLGSTLFSVGRSFILFRFSFYYDYLKLTKGERLRFLWKAFRAFAHLGQLFPHIRLQVQTCNYFLMAHSSFNADQTLRLANRYDWEEYRRLFDPHRFKIRAHFRRELLVSYQLHLFTKNRYFERVVYVYLSGCLLGDPWLMARSVGQELQNLRKYHNKFLNFIKLLTCYGYDLASTGVPHAEGKPTRSFLEGVRVLVRGRVTLGTRQLRRKFGRWILYGVVGFSHYHNHLSYGDDVVITRFGLVSIKVWLRHRSPSEGAWAFWLEIRQRVQGHARGSSFSHARGDVPVERWSTFSRWLVRHARLVEKTATQRLRCLERWVWGAFRRWKRGETGEVKAFVIEGVQKLRRDFQQLQVLAPRVRQRAFRRDRVPARVWFSTESGNRRPLTMPFKPRGVRTLSKRGGVWRTEWQQILGSAKRKPTPTGEPRAFVTRPSSPGERDRGSWGRGPVSSGRSSQEARSKPWTKR